MYTLETIKKKGVCSLSKQVFLNFSEISNSIQFADVLNWLNISFQRKDKELRGDGFIVSIEKNLFFCPDNDELKGSIINFVSHFKKVDLREAAMLLKTQFLSKAKEVQTKRDIPNLNLEWDPYLEERGINLEIANEYQIGYVKQRSILAGRIAFKIFNHSSEHIGYVGFKKGDDTWFFPKGFKRPLYNSWRLTDKRSAIVTVDPFDAIRIAAIGFKKTVSLLANSMTSEQESELKKYKYILLLHNEPDNIVHRLYQTSFIKAPELSKPLKEMSDKDILELIKPS